MERELVDPVAIADGDGRLRHDAIGWARHPIQDCRLPAVSRVEKFNYWCISNRTSALTLLFAEVGPLGAAVVSFLDLAARGPVERVHVRPGGLAGGLPDTPRGGVAVDAWRLHVAMRERGDDLHVTGEAQPLLGERIAIDVVVARPRSHETVNVLVAWDDERFHFTSKQQALPVRGVIRVGAREHRFGPDTDGFACLDFGRGRWPRGIDWRWAFGAGASGRRTIGWNLGAKWTDGTGVTESALVIDGRIHKIPDALDFDFDPRARMRPWRIRTRTGDRVALRFAPERERSIKLPLGVIGVEVHQMLGRFSGTVVADDGERLPITDLFGLAESVSGRWP